MPVKCPKCQAINRDMAEFCDHCGQSLFKDGEQTQAPPNPQGDHQKQPPIERLDKRSAPPWLKLVGFTVLMMVLTGLDDPFFYLAILCFIAYLIYFFRKYFWISPSKSAHLHSPTCKHYKRRKVFYGRVTDLVKKPVAYKKKTFEYCSFRLQETDANFDNFLVDYQGNLYPPLLVDMYAKLISDTIKQNDKVEIRGKLHKRLRVKRIINRSLDGVEVIIKGRKKLY